MSAWTVRDASPLAGLRRRSLGPLEVTAQSVAVTAPSAAMASTPLLVAANAGAATVYAYVVASLIVLLVSSCVTQFARRMVSTGSLYSFTAQGLGPVASLCAGAALLIGYGLLSMSTLLLSASYLLDLTRGAGLGFGASRLVTAAAVVGLGLGAAALMVRGVALSSRVALAVEGASLLAIGVVLSVLWLRGGAHVNGALLSPGWPRGTGLHGLGTGVALAITSFVGFESAAALGVEARHPHRIIPRALLGTAVGAGLLFILGVYVELDAAAGSLRSVATGHAPLTELAWRAGGAVLAHVVDLGIAASGFGCAVASTTALTRLLFTMAREGVASERLGAVHGRYGTPHQAIVLSITVITAVPVLLLLGGVRPWPAFSSLLTVSTFGYLLAYLLVCAAAPAFLKKIGELTTWTALTGIVAVGLLTVVLGSYLLPATSPPNRALFGLFLVMLVGAGAWLARVLVGQQGQLGAYDEAVRTDLFHPGPRP